MFSVVIPLYNKELSIESTVQSILDQSFRDFELIIVNDGSKDKSLTVVEKFKDERIRIFTKENGGECSARNYGIKMAKREWIAFIDADDLWKKDHLFIISQLILKYPDKSVFATSIRNTDEEYTNQFVSYVIEDYFVDALKKERIITSSSSVINKNCFLEVGYFNENYKLGGDLDMWCRLAKKYSFVKSLVYTSLYRLEAENRVSLKRCPVENIRLFNIDLKVAKGSERNYYKYQIIKRIFAYIIKDKNWRYSLLLIKKYNYQLFI